MKGEVTLEDLIRGFALRNAIGHGGKARLSSVLGAVFSANHDAQAKAGEVTKLAGGIVKDVNSTPLEQQKEQLKGLRLPIEVEAKKQPAGLPELENAVKGQVVMRLAPYPSGQLHLGRARMAILNDEYVKRYDGKMILVIDDTAGSADKIPIPEAYEGIPRDLEWLGIKVHETVYKSDRLDIFYSFAIKFLEKGWAYVCTCRAEELRRNRAGGRECKCRSRSVDSNICEWEKMLSGGHAEGEAVVRLKTDMKYPDAAFRDRVLLRISERAHPRVGTKYRVWPMLEFSWAIDDHLLGITHVLRGKDLMMEDKMERFMWELLGWPEPTILHHGMLGIAGAKISSSVCRKKIEAGEYEGWDDPRTWTLGSLRVRGIQVKAIRGFIISSGLTMTDVQVPIDSLYAENRRLLDPVANRYNFVRDPVSISVDGAPSMRSVKLRCHPDFKDRGDRTVPVNSCAIHLDREDFRRLKGREVRLKELYNVLLAKHVEYAGDDLSPSMAKIQWVSEPNVRAQIVMPDGFRVDGLADPGAETLRVGTIVQFVRFGFCRLDSRKGSVLIFRYAHS